MSFVSVYVCVCVARNNCVNMHVTVYVFSMYVESVCLSVCLPVCLPVCMYVCMYVCVYVCVYALMCLRAYIHMCLCLFACMICVRYMRTHYFDVHVSKEV